MDGFRQGHLPLEDGRVYQAGHLTSADQEIPDQLVKIPFLEEV